MVKFTTGMFEEIPAVFNTEIEDYKASQLRSVGGISIYFILKVIIISIILLRYGSSEEFICTVSAYLEGGMTIWLQ